MTIIRKVVETGLRQGQDESIAYTLTTTPWASSPTPGTVTAWDVTADYRDVTATVLSGTTSVSGDVLTLPTLSGLTAGHLYRIEARFTAGGNTWEPWFEVQGER